MKSRALVNTVIISTYVSRLQKAELVSTGTEHVIHSLFGGHSSKIQQHGKYKFFLSNHEGSYKFNVDVLDVDKNVGKYEVFQLNL